MVRRSAPALLGLFVCLLAAHLSSAAPAFNLDESRIRLSLDESQARVRFEVENNTGREFPARVRFELLDSTDKVQATATTDVRLRRGANTLDVSFAFRYDDLIKSERAEFPLYRLRYRVEPDAAAAGLSPLEGIVSVSEVTPDLFELTVISAPAARPGSHYSARVRTHGQPFHRAPAQGRRRRGHAHLRRVGR